MNVSRPRNLAELIDVNCEHIGSRFADEMYKTSFPESMPREAVIDSLCEFLAEVSAALHVAPNTGESPSALPPPSAVAREHGRQRFGLGHDLASVIREYGVLRDVLVQVMDEHGYQMSSFELKIVSKYLVSGIADAASRYAAERDEQLRVETEKHWAFLAHELRAPLSSMDLAFTLIKQRGELPPSRPADVLERNLKRLSELIDGALKRARQSYRVQAEYASIDLPRFLSELVEELQGAAAAKGQQIRMEFPENLLLRADPKLLWSTISNLLRNAIKFSQSGSTLNLRAKPSGGRVAIEVEDECGGLPDGAVQKVFDPFVQVGEDRSGLGLGLAIAKQAALAHAGEVRVHNIAGKGCVFTLDLPLSEP